MYPNKEWFSSFKELDVRVYMGHNNTYKQHENVQYTLKLIMDQSNS